MLKMELFRQSIEKGCLIIMHYVGTELEKNRIYIPTGATEAADWETSQKYPLLSMPTFRAALKITPASSWLKAEQTQHYERQNLN